MPEQNLSEDEKELILAIRSHPPEEQAALIRFLQDKAKHLAIQEKDREKL